MAHRPLDLPPVAARPGALGIGCGRAWRRGSSLWPGSQRTCWLSASAGCSGCRSVWGSAFAAYFALPAEPPLWLGAPVCSLLAAALRGSLAPAGRDTGPWLGCRPCSASARCVLGFTAGDARAPSWSRRRCWSGAAPTSSRRPSCWSRTAIRGQRLTARAAGDRGPRARRHAGAAPGQRARPASRRWCRAIAIRLRAHAHAAVAAGRAARLRLRPPRLLHAARRGRLRPRSGRSCSCRADNRAAGRSRSPRCARRSRTRSPRRCRATAGAIAVALLTGLRGALPDQIWDEWAIAGIAHLLSISGLHLALVAGTLFFCRPRSRWRSRRRSRCACRPRRSPPRSP